MKRPARVEVLEEVALVRLIPADDAGRHRPDVEASDEGRLREAADEPLVLGDGRDDEAGAERRGQLLLSDLDDARKGEQELAVGERVVETVAVDDRGQQIRAALAAGEPFGAATLGRHVARARLA